MNGFEFLNAYDTLPSYVKSKTRIFVLSSTIQPGDEKKLTANENVKGFYQKHLTKTIVEENCNYYGEIL
jgi:hypothetical protein